MMSWRNLKAACARFFARILWSFFLLFAINTVTSIVLAEAFRLWHLPSNKPWNPVVSFNRKLLPELSITVPLWLLLSAPELYVLFNGKVFHALSNLNPLTPQLYSRHLWDYLKFSGLRLVQQVQHPAEVKATPEIPQDRRQQQPQQRRFRRLREYIRELPASPTPQPHPAAPGPSRYSIEKHQANERTLSQRLRQQRHTVVVQHQPNERTLDQRLQQHHHTRVVNDSPNMIYEHDGGPREVSTQDETLEEGNNESEDVPPQDDPKPNGKPDETQSILSLEAFAIPQPDQKSQAQHNSTLQQQVMEDDTSQEVTLPSMSSVPSEEDNTRLLSPSQASQSVDLPMPIPNQRIPISWTSYDLEIPEILRAGASPQAETSTSSSIMDRVRLKRPSTSYRPKASKPPDNPGHESLLTNIENDSLADDSLVDSATIQEEFQDPVPFTDLSTDTVNLPKDPITFTTLSVQQARDNAHDHRTADDDTGASEVCPEISIPEHFTEPQDSPTDIEMTEDDFADYRFNFLDSFTSIPGAIRKDIFSRVRFLAPYETVAEELIAAQKSYERRCLAHQPNDDHHKDVELVGIPEWYAHDQIKMWVKHDLYMSNRGMEWPEGYEPISDVKDLEAARRGELLPEDRIGSEWVFSETATVSPRG